MLYISRIVGGSIGRRYGVVDTDDCTEMLVSYQELEETVSGVRIKKDGSVSFLHQPIQIHGVTVKEDDIDTPTGQIMYFFTIDKIDVYTGPGCLPLSRIKRI